MSIVTAQRADMCYCPGCSHGMVLEQIGHALDRIGREPQDVCIVSDIGCIGTADRYFASHTFHGLHGRSITYAEGIKRARPDLLVIVLIGDGGCGIGTAHLVHAARRNADIKVVVCNNFNFGMTGGQHSPTTPCDARTSTTPGGAADRPFDVCATVAVNGAAYVARHGAFDSEIPTVMQSALSSDGFALMEIWELCTAYFVPGNRLNRSSLAALSQRLQMPFGVLHQTPPRRSERPPVDESKHATAHAAAPAPAPIPKLPWPARTEICVAGSAGQRIRSAVGVIGELTVSGGLFAAQQDDFPITVRKGFSVSNLIVAPAPIRYTGVDDPDLVLVLSHDGLARFRSRLRHLKPTCIVAADTDLNLPPLDVRTVPLHLGTFEKQCGKASAALAALAFVAALGGYFKKDELLIVAEASLAGPYRDASLTALRTGFDTAQRDAATVAATTGGKS